MRLDLHVHSVYSPDGMIELEQLAKKVKALGLEGFALTDHDSLKGLKKAEAVCKKHKLVFVPGVEVSAEQGHILGYYINSPIKKGLSGVEVVEEIHSQGGLAVAAHPYDFLRSGVGGKVVRSLKLDGIEVTNSKSFFGNHMANQLADELGIAKTGGSDAHILEEVGGAWTECTDLRKDIKKCRTAVGGGFTTKSVKSRVVRLFK